MHAEVKRKLIEIKPIHKYYLNNFNLPAVYLLSGGPLEIEGEGGGGGAVLSARILFFTNNVVQDFPGHMGVA